jgi:valyl-tRNA synthetase
MKIFPNSWEKPYLLWLDNLKDWCISRQIWWGHRIPIYYCQNSEFRNQKADKQKTTTFCPPIAAEEMPKVCPNCQSADLIQDEDVLDTWFSSALWPFSVLYLSR